MGATGFYARRIERSEKTLVREALALVAETRQEPASGGFDYRAIKAFFRQIFTHEKAAVFGLFTGENELIGVSASFPFKDFSRFEKEETQELSRLLEEKAIAEDGLHYVTGISLKKEHRGKKLSTLLTAAHEDYARSQGVKGLVASVLDSNAAWQKATAKKMMGIGAVNVGVKPAKAFYLRIQ